MVAPRETVGADLGGLPSACGLASTSSLPLLSVVCDGRRAPRSGACARLVWAQLVAQPGATPAQRASAVQVVPRVAKCGDTGGGRGSRRTARRRLAQVSSWCAAITMPELPRQLKEDDRGARIFSRNWTEWLAARSSTSVLREAIISELRHGTAGPAWQGSASPGRDGPGRAGLGRHGSISLRPAVEDSAVPVAWAWMRF